MNEKERLEVLEQMRFAFQRFRSVIMEQADEDGASVKDLADMFPWIFGPKCPLPAIQKCLDRERVTGMELYNFLLVLHRFAPEVKVGNLDYDFPEPDVRMAMWN